MQALQVLKIILSLLPLLIEAVRVVEAALPASGQGASKLTLVRATIEAGYTAAAEVTVKFEALWPALEKTVAAVVSTLNALGEFRK